MHDGVPIAGKVLPHIIDNLVIVLMGPTERLTGFDVLHLSLLRFYPRKCVAMSSIEASLFTETLKTNCIRVDAVQPSQCLYQ